jgi:hypothetical protein
METTMLEMNKMPTPADLVARIPTKLAEKNEPVRIEPGHQCRVCGKFKPSCIKEPGIDWTCRECYTGLTNEEIRNRMRTLSNIIGLATKRMPSADKIPF